MTNTQSKISKNATQIVDAQSSSVEPELAQLSSRAPLPITDVAEEALKECIICYESLNTTKNICITECGHEFCFSCMMKHVQRNNGCPMCRSAIIEEVDTDEFSEGEYDEDDDATIEEEVEELSDEYPIENLVAAFEAKGYGLIDALSLLMYKFSRTDPKYTKEYINKLQDDIEDMNEELQGECEEREHMGMEDANMIITAV